MKTFEGLFAELERKASARPAGSATVEELDRGVHFIGKKLVEDAAESCGENQVYSLHWIYCIACAQAPLYNGRTSFPTGRVRHKCHGIG